MITTYSSIFICIVIIYSFTSATEAIKCLENPTFACGMANATECSKPKYNYVTPIVKSGYPAAHIVLSDEPNVCLNMTETRSWDNGIKLVTQVGFYVTGPTKEMDNVCRSRELNLNGRLERYKYCTCLTDNCNRASSSWSIFPSLLPLLYLIVHFPM